MQLALEKITCSERVCFVCEKEKNIKRYRGYYLFIYYGVLLGPSPINLTSKQRYNIVF